VGISSAARRSARRVGAAIVVGVIVASVAGAARQSAPDRGLPPLVAWARGARLVGGEGVVRQRRANDCGPAALAEGLRQLGLDIPYPDPASAVRLGPRGCALEDLAREAARRGAASRLHRWDPSEVGEVSPPAVLHLREGHFVLFLGRTASGEARLVDPSLGRLEQSPRSLARQWSGWALELHLPERRPG
jgi:ABC-type bacteriocin/lantibiotic exporter with double-glycine peptidase domain